MKVLIIASINSSNLGDKAIFLTMKKLFESHGHSVTGLDLNRRENRTSIGIGGCEHIITNGLYLNDKELLAITQKDSKVSFKSLLKHVQPDFVRRLRVWHYTKKSYVRHKNEWTEIFKNHDVVVFGGGALLIDNLWNFPLALLYASRLARKIEVPYGCVGCSVGETFSCSGGRWLKEFLADCSFVTLRDSMSGISIRKLGVTEHMVYIDSAIRIGEIIKKERDSAKGILGINVLSYVLHPRITRRGIRRYFNVLRRLIERIDKMPELGLRQVVLFNTGETSDMRAALKLYDQVKSGLRNLGIKVCNKMQRLEDMCGVISQCDVVIGTRLHSSIIPKSYGIPIIGIDWDRKVSGFYEMIGLKEFCFDYETFDVEMIIDAIEKIKSNHFNQESGLEEQIGRFNALPRYIFQKAGIAEDGATDKFENT